MKQLYTIGIIVAILLLVLMGLNKLNQPRAEISINESTDSPGTIELTSNEDTTSDNEEVMADESDTTTLVMKTNMGDITIELFTGAAPITAGNFATLASSDFYDGVKFHRVIDGFMIQGGDPKSKDDARVNEWGTGGPDYRIQDEFGPGLSNVRGTLSMANSGPNTGGSQFFINTVDNTFLDNKHAVFGRVVSGMEVVDAISKVETGEADRPMTPVVIEDIITG